MTLMVRFEDGRTLSGKLFFRAAEHSFSYEAADDVDLECRAGSDGVTSLVADTLQIEVGVETGQLLFAWGYLPANSWSRTSLPQPEALPGVLRLVPGEDLEPGVSLSISRSSNWKAEFDQAAGCVRVSAEYETHPTVVKIADGVAVGVQDGVISSIWLWPEFVD
ncbi:hypothetical protein ACIBJE_05765 [Micromonospora sp. NPDC050187]|uniref:hypothetical protein n=1 Tax=Micromonospora sp. NPDC050187 TaxID=3364277 RepID=UPI0037B520BF